MKKFFAGVLSLVLTVSGVLCGCGDNSSSPKSKEKKLEANDASDFRWQEITDNDDQSPENIGGIIINGYVGDRTDVVIPKSIQDKPVVAIGDYAFCPYSKNEFTDYYYDDEDLEDKLFEFAGVEELSVWYEDVIEGNEEDIDALPYITNDLSHDAYLSTKRSSMYDKYKQDLLDKYLEGHEPVSDITSISIPTTVNYIGFIAFGFCDSLETVEIYGTDNEKDLYMDCYHPFFANTKLKSFNFYLEPYGNKEYFEYCSSLEDVYIYPDSNGHVDLSWLEDAENINSIHIADGTTSISGITENIKDRSTPKLPYSGSSNIIIEKGVSEIYLPSSLEDISDHTFCTHMADEFNCFKCSNYICSEIEEMECPAYASVIMIAPEGSYAESYANENGIICVNSKDKITKKMKENQKSSHKKQYDEALSRSEVKRIQAEAYKYANKIMIFSGFVLANLEGQGYDIESKCILSSDKSKNYQCNDSILDDFYDSLTNELNFFDSNILEDYDYFSVGSSYVVVRNKNNPDAVVTYPKAKIYQSDGEFKDWEKENYSYEELYEICIDEIGQNADS